MDTINVQPRSPEVKAKKLRRLGLVPCIVFGGDLENTLSIQMEEAPARKLVRMKREGSKIQLNLEGTIIPVQIKEKEMNTIKNEIVHISFQVLKPEQKINSVIHIILKNSDITAGVLEKMLLEIPYSSLPADMIDTIDIDIQGIPVGTILTVSDIPELNNEKIDLQVDAGSIVLRISERLHAPRPVEE